MLLKSQLPLVSSSKSLRPSKQKKKKLLCYSDSVLATTGFGIVSKHILNALYQTGEYEIHQLAINHPGEFWDTNKVPYSMIPAKMLDPKDPYGNAMFLEALKKNDYDVVLIINDTFVVNTISTHMEPLRKALVQAGRKAFKLVYYYPVDCVVDPTKAGMIKAADYPVPYTNFARDETVAALGQEYSKLQPIYHGVDVANFFPIHPQERNLIRKEAFGVEDDTFLITNVNRNNTRKDIGKTILAFSQFHKTVPNSKLYLHMAPQDHGAGPAHIDLFPLINQLGLKLDEDVYFPRNFHVANGYPIELLNKLYCCGDVFLTTHLGEGYGLTIQESIAAGTPVVVPDNTVMPELISKNGGYIYPCKEWIYCDNSGARKLGRLEDIYNSLLDAYVDWRDNTKRRANIIKTGHGFTNKYSWDNVCKDWVKLFKNIDYSTPDTQLSDNGEVL